MNKLKEIYLRNQSYFIFICGGSTGRPPHGKVLKKQFWAAKTVKIYYVNIKIFTKLLIDVIIYKRALYFYS